MLDLLATDSPSTYSQREAATQLNLALALPRVLGL